MSDLSPFFITGPTGSGKSSVALALAKQCGGEIVNADAFQVYAGIGIITAQPSAEDQTWPHHLYGMVDPAETFDVSVYRHLAESIIKAIQARGKIPIVVGGSGLYVKMLTHGMAPVPPGDPVLREAFEARTLEDLCKELAELDPEGAAQTNLKNRRYVIRALEICLLTGEKMSEIKASWAAKEPDFEGVVVSWERETLYERINQRVPMMMEAGAMEEVASIQQWSDTSQKAIGVREIQACLEGTLAREEMVEVIAQASRRLAKRQLSWFRREKGYFQLIRGSEGLSEFNAIVKAFPRMG